MITPLLFRKHFNKSKLTQFPFKFRSFSSEIVSVEEKRQISSKDTEAPTFFPTSDFPYDYKPMSIFEEEMGKTTV